MYGLTIHVTHTLQTPDHTSYCTWHYSQFQYIQIIEQVDTVTDFLHEMHWRFMHKGLLSKPFDKHTQVCNTFIFETSQNNNSIIRVQLQEIFCVVEQNVWRTVIGVSYKCLYCVIMENTIMVTSITMTLYKSVINQTFQVTRYLSVISYKLSAMFGW